ncbi:hypothetical protein CAUPRSCDRAFT_13041, partial [Caulochytrium protostelioides]
LAAALAAGKRQARAGVAEVGAVDAVCMLDEEWFISGHDTGSLSLWSTKRKKPTYTCLRAHFRPRRFDPMSPLAPRRLAEAVRRSGAAPPAVKTPTAASIEAEAVMAPVASDSPESPVGTWITALAAIPFSDTFASGSSDGKLRLWAVPPHRQRFVKLAEFAVSGYINSLTWVEVPVRVWAQATWGRGDAEAAAGGAASAAAGGVVE